MADVQTSKNERRHRYEACIDGELVGFGVLPAHEQLIVFTHTEVDDRCEGHGRRLDAGPRSPWTTYAPRAPAGGAAAARSSRAGSSTTPTTRPVHVAPRSTARGLTAASTSTSSSSVPACPASARRTACSTECPDRSFAILEARDAMGGTWDLFRYPGVRSDSDMFTLGYQFKPWRAAKAIADGADDPGLHPRDRRRVRHRASTSATAPRSSAPTGRREQARWTLAARDAATDRAR